MRPVVDILEQRITAVMASATGQEGCAAIVTPATDPKFGDYQANGVMALAKKIKANPRKLAEQVVESLAIDDICERPEVAGPGFINLRLKAAFIADRLLEINADEQDRLGIEKVARPKTIVVDFSGPNIAKQMHVGHLRSTIIGDCICRLLEFEGHKVIRQNHIGDWGTQFGRVILGLWHVCMAEKHGGEAYYLSESKELKMRAQDKKVLQDLCREIRDRHERDWREDSRNMLGDGEKFFKPFLGDLRKRNASEMWEASLLVYQYVNVLEDSTEGMGLAIPIVVEGKEQAKPYESLSRHVTAMLQEGGNRNLQEREAWKVVTDLTLQHCDEIYSRLRVKLGTADVRGESEYKDDLPKVVDDLKANNLAVESDGAVCVFPEGFKNKEGKGLPFIIQKSDGAYLYATTDLAAIRYRINELKAQKIIYVTDARQKLHFEMLFAVARMAKWVGDDVDLVHVMFGSVLGENGKPLKTRSGENVKLKDLLDEAVERAIAIVEEKNPDLSPDKKDQIAKAVGIGAVKYADFSNNRTSDYVFSFDKMLAMDGNTAPYMQYAYARIRSIERMGKSRKLDIKTELAGVKDLNLGEPAELELAKYLIRYAEAIEAAVADYRPNYLTAYLYELAQKFSVFYTNCPVLGAAPDKRPTRLLLCDLTAKTIRHGLSDLLGIEVVEQM
ncbi:MAG TPA: arginine--tRNA ligase [Sedimentisphaerales bacterium]|nr:arginine--tRNA ligase [Sedimentisphaerales bacterium]